MRYAAAAFHHYKTADADEIGATRRFLALAVPDLSPRKDTGDKRLKAELYSNPSQAEYL